MTIQYLEPLRRALDRASAMLFHPFDLGKWIVLGFTCWLALLGRGGAPGAGFWWHLGDRQAEATAWAGASSFAAEDWLWVPVVGWVVGCIVLFVLALLVVFLWLGSRGELLFLDNVVHDRWVVAEPWRRLARLGNSLFLWRLGFVLVAVVAMALAASPMIAALVLSSRMEAVALPAILASLALIFLVAVALAYTELFLIHFVVPIMVRDNLTATAAWGRFVPLLRERLGHFLAYGLVVLGLHLVVVAAVVAAGLATCCIAFLVVATPYVGTVVLLPVYVTFRAFSLEFLGQMEPRYRLLVPVGEEGGGA